MDDDERDPDLVKETWEQRRKLALERQRRLAWDEPPEYYTSEEGSNDKDPFTS